MSLPPTINMIVAMNSVSQLKGAALIAGRVVKTDSLAFLRYREVQGVMFEKYALRRSDSNVKLSYHMNDLTSICVMPGPLGR